MSNQLIHEPPITGNRQHTEILATEATLSTLNVEVKALVVSGKQMTLAVFRQLPEMHALNDEENLWSDVQYWGMVRYSIKDEGDLWAVIEQDGKLYRGRIDVRLPRLSDLIALDYEGDESEEMWELRATLNGIQEQHQEIRQAFFEKHHRNPHLCGVDVQDWGDWGASYLRQELQPEYQAICEQQKREQARIKGKLKMACFSQIERQETSIKSLLALPQLFIAV